MKFMSDIKGLTIFQGHFNQDPDRVPRVSASVRHPAAACLCQGRGGGVLTVGGGVTGGAAV